MVIDSLVEARYALSREIEGCPCEGTGIDWPARLAPGLGRRAVGSDARPLQPHPGRTATRARTAGRVLRRARRVAGRPTGRCPRAGARARARGRCSGVSRPARQLRLAKPPAAGVLTFDGGTLTRVGLDLDDIGVEHWSDVGRALADIGQSLRWAIGDWLLFGEHRDWGDKYTDAQAWFGLDYKSLRNCAYVASAVEVSRRRDNLSWTHHAEVAAFEPDEQDRWLDRAAKNGWTVRELRAWMKGA